MGLAASIRNFMGMPEDEAYYDDEDAGAASGQAPRQDQEPEEAPCSAVVLAKPERFDEASAIADNLAENRMVLLDLEETPREAARRLIDFLGGAAYARDGMLTRVAANVYLITPYNVEFLDPATDPTGSLYF